MLTTENDITIASTTATQAELDHATGPNWREPFDPAKPAEKTEAAKTETTSDTTAEPGKPATKTAPASEPGKAGAKEGESEADKELPPGVKKAIDRATFHRKEAERRASAAEAELARLRGDKPADTAKPAAKANGDPEPQLKDFKTWDEWNEARNRWVVRDEQRKVEANQHQAREQETVKQTFDGHLARVEAYTTEHPDFVEKVESLDGFQFASDNANRSFQVAIVETDNGPQVLEYLADHPEEMDKFAGYSPVKVQLAIGRISAALSPSVSEAPPAPKTVPVSRTPAPTTKVRHSAAAPATRLDDPKLSTDDFIKIRNEQEQNKRRH